MGSEKAPALPVVDPAISLKSHRGTSFNAKRGFLAVASTLALFLIFRATCPTNLDLSVPECLRSLSTLGTNDAAHVAKYKSAVPQLGVPEKVQRRWGQYSPYYPAGKYVAPPDGCVIDQVNILQRHGARYPNHDDDYDVAVERLQAAKKLHDDLKFLKHYEYTLGADDLIAFGAQQSREAGQLAYQRYSHLLSGGLPFIRASGMQRVIDTAGNWSTGFIPSMSSAETPHLPPHAPLPIQIIPETQNDTLNSDCPNAPKDQHWTNQWLHKFAPPILKKLHKMAKGAKLEEEDVRRLVGVCVFETLAEASEQMRGASGTKKPKSKFCDIFTLDDWKDWEYWGDVEKYYKTGYGNPLGPVQGVGYVNELLARLSGLPVVDRTQHNYSLPFPLDRSIYADFTHENLMIAVYSAMGLFNVSKHLHPKHRPKDEDREWLASHMVPFSARMVVERLRCPIRISDAEESEAELEGHHQLSARWNPNLLAGSTEDTQKHKTEQGIFVRIFVNDELQPLEFCNNNRAIQKHGSHWQRKHGLCALIDFIQSQGYARRGGDGDFEKCYN